MRAPKRLRCLILLIGLLVVTTAAAQEGVAITETARQHFRAGVAYIEDPAGPKYEEAYREFRLAYLESPSYKIDNNLGLCALNLERDGEAIEAYERFLAKATPEDIPEDKRAQMERDIATLKSSLVRLTLTSVPGNITITDERLANDGRRLINHYELKDGRLALGLHPGHHRLTAQASGFVTQTWEFEADSASTHTHVFNLEPAAPPAPKPVATPTEPRSPRPTPTTETGARVPALVYGGAVATGVFALGATVTGLMYHAKRNEYESANDGTKPEKARDLRSEAQTLGLVTDIGVGSAIVSAIATTIYYVATSSPTTRTQASSSALRFAPVASQQVAGVTVTARF